MYRCVVAEKQNVNTTYHAIQTVRDTNSSQHASLTGMNCCKMNAFFQTCGAEKDADFYREAKEADHRRKRSEKFGELIVSDGLSLVDLQRQKDKLLKQTCSCRSLAISSLSLWSSSRLCSSSMSALSASFSLASRSYSCRSRARRSVDSSKGSTAVEELMPSQSAVADEATVLHSTTFIYEKPEGLWLCWLLLLLFREHHSGKVWKRLSLELWNLERVQRTCPPLSLPLFKGEGTDLHVVGLWEPGLKGEAERLRFECVRLLFIFLRLLGCLSLLEPLLYLQLKPCSLQFSAALYCRGSAPLTGHQVWRVRHAGTLLFPDLKDSAGSSTGLLEETTAVEKLLHSNGSLVSFFQFREGAGQENIIMT
ncbi:hypothetical protein INR49_000535 [Caranx melampygus]|nr:hypothetical protein INR49_000535 [Caranx melampygus]